MKPLYPKAFCMLRLLLSLALVAVGTGQGGSLRFIAQQIETIGPRQWLGLVVGSFIPGTLLLAPVTQRIAGVLARGPASLPRSVDQRSLIV